MPSDGIIVSDTGHAGIWTSTMIDLNSCDQEYFRCAGTLGWAFPAAMGIKCAYPQRTVICFTGDGGIWYHLAEFDTAVKYNINTITIINNNHSYNQEKDVNEKMYGRKTKNSDELWILPDTNFAEYAKMSGGVGITISNADDIESTLRSLINIEKPVLIDVKTDIEAIAEQAYIPYEIRKKYQFNNSTL